MPALPHSSASWPFPPVAAPPDASHPARVATANPVVGTFQVMHTSARKSRKRAGRGVGQDSNPDRLMARQDSNPDPRPWRYPLNQSAVARRQDEAIVAITPAVPVATTLTPGVPGPGPLRGTGPGRGYPCRSADHADDPGPGPGAAVAETVDRRGAQQGDA